MGPGLRAARAKRDQGNDFRVRAGRLQLLWLARNGFKVEPEKPHGVQSVARPRGRDFAAWIGLVARQDSTGGKQKLGRSPSRATATCDAFSSSGRSPCCGVPRRTLGNISGSRNSWRGGPLRLWRWHSPTKWRARPGRWWPTAAHIGRLSLRKLRIPMMPARHSNMQATRSEMKPAIVRSEAGHLADSPRVVGDDVFVFSLGQALSPMARR
jgi:hypothetical protein